VWNCLLRQTLSLRRLTSIQLLKERFGLSTQFHKSDNKQKSHAEHAKHAEKWYRFIIITTSAASANSAVNKESLER